VSQETEDNVRLDPRLIRIGLQALDSVSEKKGVDFFTLSMDHKKEFLVDHGPEVVSTAKRLAGPLARYFNDRMVVLLENGDTAGLYFMKVKPHG
jgi:hypothetical protein